MGSHEFDGRLAAMLAGQRARETLLADVAQLGLTQTQVETSFLRALLSAPPSGRVDVFGELLACWAHSNRRGSTDDNEAAADDEQAKEQDDGVRTAIGAVPLVLLEHVLNIEPLDRWPGVLSAFERERKPILDACFPRGRIAFLLICTEAFKRTSPLLSAELRGRLHVLLSYFLSPFDRSLIPGDTCVLPASSRAVDDDDDDDDDDNGDDDLLSGEEGEVALDRGRLFDVFWQLQRGYFHAGKLATFGPTQLNDLAGLLDELSAAFERHPPTRQGVLSPRVFVQPGSCCRPGRFMRLFAAKSFRQSVLVQALLFLNALPATDAVAPGLARLEARLLALLDLYDGGGRLSTCVLTAVDQETDWNALKKDKSPQLILPPVGKRAQRSDDRRQVKKQRRPDAFGLTRLWNGQYTPLNDPSRKYQPSLQQFLRPLVDQLDPRAGIEPEYLLSNDAVYAWRASRFMVQANVSYFCKSVLPSLNNAALEFFPEQKTAYLAHAAELAQLDDQLFLDEDLADTSSQASKSPVVVDDDVIDSNVDDTIDDTINDLTNDVNDPINDPINDINDPINDINDPINDINDPINDPINDITNDINDLDNTTYEENISSDSKQDDNDDSQNLVDGNDVETDRAEAELQESV